jgi:tryptophan synthase alpha chain
VTAPALEATLRRVRDGGRKAFVPYVTAGLPGVGPDLLRGLCDVGADAIEIGIPFSDPVMDGPVIQEAARRALDAGATPRDALALVERAALDAPVAFMGYLNPILAAGLDAFAAAAAGAGVSGAIVPDLPVDEASAWLEVCGRRGIAPILLAAPNAEPGRLEEIARGSRGFVYCVSTLGVTGSRERLSTAAREVVSALRPLTDTPLLVGVGVSTPKQAAQACAFADGVVVGTALMEPLLRGAPDEALTRAERFRAAVA